MIEFIEDLIEKKIRESVENGDFKNLPGEGLPINLNDDEGVPNDLKMAYRILKNSGMVPTEVSAYQEIQSLRQQLKDNQNLTSEEVEKLRLKLISKESQYNIAIERMRKNS